MSYLVQMLALTVQNFLSAATGIGVVIALIRGFCRHSAKTIGNAWVDLTRSTLYILLPLSVVLALALVSQGVIQNFDAYQTATTLEVTHYDAPKLDGDGQALKDAQGNGLTEPAATRQQTLAMVTGDNRLTAAAIAAEAGVDDFLSDATPETKLALIRQHQGEGRLVAMTGDGTNDAPALAQADVAVAMNTGTQAAKEAGNMVDLDSNPTKLIEIVETGKQMLMTRGALTTFSIANDIAKYFAIIPAAFVTTYPSLSALNVMGLASPSSAILSAVIFNALIIIFLIPLALKGVGYRPLGAAMLLRRNLLIYGLGGVVVPFAGIKLIDLTIAAAGLA